MSWLTERKPAGTSFTVDRPAGRRALAGARVWVKHENHQPVCAFKVRGGVNLIAQLGPDARRRGVIAASTGNHGQSVAYAASLFGVPAIVCVPEQANPVKVESMQALGAEVICHGRDFDEAREHCEKLAAERGSGAAGRRGPAWWPRRSARRSR